MGRFVSKFGAHLARAIGEQVVGGVLAVLVLIFQIRYGLIRKAEETGAWWSIIWPYLIIVALLVIWCAIKTWWELRGEDREHAQDLRAYASGQAAMMFLFEAQATELLSQLDDLWHHWNNAGESLIHPLNINPIKNLDHYGSIDLELRDFKLAYGKHLQRIGLDVPKFKSAAMVGGYPSDREYAVVLRDLREHTQALGEIAKDLYETGVPL